jgi:hypothetical protein
MNQASFPKFADLGAAVFQQRTSIGITAVVESLASKTLCVYSSRTAL